VRVVGLDIHRVFAEAVMLDEGKIVRLGRVGMTRDHLEAFAKTLTRDDHVVVEATGNAAAVTEVISPHVGRVVIANPRQVRLIAHAKIKTDTIDATVLAKLYASNFLPEVWVPDAETQALRSAGDAAQPDRPSARAAQNDHPIHSARSSATAMSTC
jgi:transposase